MTALRRGLHMRRRNSWFPSVLSIFRVGHRQRGQDEKSQRSTRPHPEAGCYSIPLSLKGYASLRQDLSGRR